VSPGQSNYFVIRDCQFCGTTNRITLKQLLAKLACGECHLELSEIDKYAALQEIIDNYEKSTSTIKETNTILHKSIREMQTELGIIGLPSIAPEIVVREIQQIQKELKKAYSDTEKAKSAGERAKSEAKSQVEEIRSKLLITKQLKSDRKIVVLENDDISDTFQPRYPESLAGLEFQITNAKLIRWLSSDVSEGDSFQIPENAIVHGEGPISVRQMKSHLKEWGCRPCPRDSCWIIVGRDNWSPETLDQYIEDCSGEEIMIVSQEMFLAGVISGHHPFCATKELLLVFANGHPALQYLLKSGIEWPFISDFIKDGVENYFMYSADESPLVAMGYRAQSGGLNDQQRRAILEDAFLGDLPEVESGSESYMQQWSTPSSRRRLHRMAHHIAWLIRTHRGISNHNRAVQKWESDLLWLNKRFFRPWMRFKWPNTQIS
jgi:hypothetical protein